jgi:hypothetical protein
MLVLLMAFMIRISFLRRVRYANSKENLPSLARQGQSSLRAIDIIGQCIEKIKVRRIGHR